MAKLLCENQQGSASELVEVRQLVVIVHCEGGVMCEIGVPEGVKECVAASDLGLA